MWLLARSMPPASIGLTASESPAGSGEAEESSGLFNCWPCRLLWARRRGRLLPSTDYGCDESCEKQPASGPTEAVPDDLSRLSSLEEDKVRFALSYAAKDGNLPGNRC